MLVSMKKVAITGGLASGKSSVSHFFQELGACVISADQIVHQLLNNDKQIVQRVLEIFGPEVLVNDSPSSKNQKLDRSKIAEKAFQQPKLLQDLEKLLHPAVHEEIEKQFKKACLDKTFKLFIAEIPLLFEKGEDVFYDMTIAVMSSSEECAKRFALSSNSTQGEYERRMAHQFTNEEKAAKATYVLDNNGSLEQLRSHVQKLYEKIVNPNRES